MKINFKILVGVIIIFLIYLFLDALLIGYDLTSKNGIIITELEQSLESQKNIININAIILIVIRILLISALYYAMTKIILKKEKLDKESLSKIILSIFIISLIILVIITCLSLILKYNDLDSISHKLEIKENIISLQKQNILINNLKTLILRTLIVSIITIFLERKWISKILSNINNETQNIEWKKLSIPIIISISVVIIECAILGYLYFNNNNNIEISISISSFAEKEQIEELRNEIEKIDNIKSITFESKEEALNKLKEKFKGSEKLLENYSNEKNPLKNKFIVEVKEKYKESIIEQIKKLQYVKEVSSQ